MSSITLTLSGNSAHLQAEYFPTIDLSDGNYVCGLIDFQTFNSIPNVDGTNNMFYYGSEIDDFTKYGTETYEIWKNVNDSNSDKKTSLIKKIQLLR